MNSLTLGSYQIRQNVSNSKSTLADHLEIGVSAFENMIVAEYSRRRKNASQQLTIYNFVNISVIRGVYYNF